MADWARRSWRWEILQRRAILDRERSAGGSLDSPTAEAALLRLVELYHCQIEADDPYHHRVRPPLRRAVNRKGTKVRASAGGAHRAGPLATESGWPRLSRSRG